MMTSSDCTEIGHKRANRGIELGAGAHEHQIRRGMLHMLYALLASPTGCATTDDAVDCLTARHADGGRWRASIPRRLKAAGIIVAERITQSARSARHAGFLTVWKLVDCTAAEELRTTLANEFKNERPATQKRLPGID